MVAWSTTSLPSHSKRIDLQSPTRHYFVFENKHLKTHVATRWVQGLFYRVLRCFQNPNLSTGPFGSLWSVFHKSENSSQTWWKPLRVSSEIELLLKKVFKPAMGKPIHFYVFLKTLVFWLVNLKINVWTKARSGTKVRENDSYQNLFSGFRKKQDLAFFHFF